MTKKVSDEVLLAEIAVRHTWARAVRMLLGLIGLAIVVLATWPVAEVLGGRTTVLNVTFALSATVAVTGVGGATAAWGSNHRRRANRLDQRNKGLSRDVKELQARLREANLSTEVTR